MMNYTYYKSIYIYISIYLFFRRIRACAKSSTHIIMMTRVHNKKKESASVLFFKSMECYGLGRTISCVIFIWIYDLKKMYEEDD